MKKIIIFFTALMIGCSSHASTVQEVTDNLRRDNTTLQFILQFKGSPAYRAIKAEEYDVKYWKSLSESDDALASYVLLQYYLVNDRTAKAIKYAKITYAQTNEKAQPLYTLHSLYETAGKERKAAGVAYVLGEMSPSFLTSESYTQALNEFGSKKMEKLGDKIQAELNEFQSQYSNHSVKYTFEM